LLSGIEADGRIVIVFPSVDPPVAQGVGL